MEDILVISKASIEDLGFLDLSYRKMIWNFFGDACYIGKQYEDIMNSHNEIIPEALKYRVRLGELCVDKVMPIWDLKTNSDPWLRNLIGLTNSYLYAGTSAKTLYNEYCDYVDFLMFSSSGTYMIVAEATTKLAQRAFYDIELIEPNYNKYKHDSDMYYTERDVEYLASMSYAGYMDNRFKWYEEKRKEFWMWYVDEAVPSVLKS